MLLHNHFVQHGHPLIAPSDFLCLVLLFLFEFLVKFHMQSFQLLLELHLVSLEGLIHLLTFINGVLLDVLDFPDHKMKPNKCLTY
jgi:hypothetical protein